MKITIFVLILLSFLFLSAETLVLEPEGINSLEVISSDANGSLLQYNLSALETSQVTISNEVYTNLYIKGENQLMQKDAPQLPFSVCSLIIPGDAEMQLTIQQADYIELPMQVAPSKGFLEIGRNYEDVEFAFGDEYSRDTWFPENVVKTGQPYILRDLRGIDCNIIPVQYNPIQQKIRIYTEIIFSVNRVGISSVNVKDSAPDRIVRAFAEIYQHHFCNYQQYMSLLRYDEIMDIPGKLLIICFDDFAQEMQPLIDWKIQKGIETEMVMISDIGTTSTTLLNYIQSYYESEEDLTWVLFVGDSAQIPVLYSYSNYAGDGFFALVDGTDGYPDIIVGRFSAETIPHVTTQVERTIYYERDITGGSWLNRAAGCAYNGGGGGIHNEAGPVHMNYIRDDLLAYGYETVDQIYEGQGGNTQMLADAINDGRGMINYLGHGDITFYYSIPFDMNDIMALQNNNQLPFIHNCACLVGHFAGQTCFGEAWLRAENDDGPIGAIAFLGSAESQWIGVPEFGQDEYVDLLCAEAKITLGGLWFNSIAYAMEETNEFSQLATWNLFGDPSLCVRSKEPQPIDLVYLPTIIIGMAEYSIEADAPGIQVCLTRDGEIQANGFTDENGDLTLDLSDVPMIPGFLTLTATGLNKIVLTDEIQMIPATGPYLYIDEFGILSGEDEFLEAGETVLIDLQLCNYGSEDATEINITMTVDSEEVELLDAEEYIATIPSQQTLNLEDILSFQLSDEIGAGCPILVELEISCAEDCWERSLWLCTAAPAGLWVNPPVFNIELTAGETVTKGLAVLNNLEDTEEFTLRVAEIGTRNIEGSYVSCATENYLPGQLQEWSFTAHNHSSDDEWICEIILDFPEEIDVLSTTSFRGSGGGDMLTESELGEGADISWCGISPNGWGFLHDAESATATLEFQVDQLSLDSLSVNWQLIGDGYGEEPHQQSGTLNFINPLKWVELKDIHKYINAGNFYVFEFEIQTEGLEPGFYACDLVLANDDQEFTIPLNLNITEPSTISETDITGNIFSLQTYPNPFNPLVNIQYSLAQAGQTSISIYNIKGQKVADLFDGFQEKGKKQLIWDAQTHSSGVYFLSLHSNERQQISKLLLLK
ncbi:MAG: T9SS type A sorting domain-containing protein [Candidatus Cloacimonetes bacterium]|nr:T9SS type A sorting domain-containing protein [Candidatus Cloacimonadota bacterium]